MGFFKKQKEETAPPVKDTVSEKFNGFTVKLTTNRANWMALQTEGFTKKGWVAALACFVLLMGGYSGYLVVSGFTGRAALFTIAAINKPAHADDTGDTKVQAHISDAEYRRIKGFHTYMDSLARDPTGRKAYDSLTANRPGLMDSIRLIENYYQQHKTRTP